MATTVVPWVTAMPLPSTGTVVAGGVRPLRRRRSAKLGPGSSPGENWGNVIRRARLAGAGDQRPRPLPHQRSHLLHLGIVGVQVRRDLPQHLVILVEQRDP